MRRWRVVGVVLVVVGALGVGGVWLAARQRVPSTLAPPPARATQRVVPDGRALPALPETPRAVPLRSTDPALPDSLVTDGGVATRLVLRGEVVRRGAGVEAELVLQHLVTSTDARGLFELEVDAPSGQSVPLYARRGALRSSAWWIKVDDPPAWVTFALDEPVAVTGVVRDRDSGDPVRGARVSCPTCAAEVVTDERGRFRLEGGASGQDDLDVEAKAPGYFTQRSSFRVTSGQPLTVVVELKRGVSVAGRVVDGARRPVGGAQVTAWRGKERTQVVTAADGRFELQLVPRVYRLRAAAPDGRASPVTPIAAPVTGLELVVGDGVVVRATVVDDDTDAPVEAAHVKVEQPVLMVTVECVTASDGVCTARGLGEGPTELSAKVGLVSAHHHALTGAPKEVTLRLPARRTLRGRVLPRAAGLDGELSVFVRTEDGRVEPTVDGEGRFVVEDLPREPLVVGASDQSSHALVELGEADDEVTLTLDSSYPHATGRVVDERRAPRPTFVIDGHVRIHGDGRFDEVFAEDDEALHIDCPGCVPTSVALPAAAPSGAVVELGEVVVPTGPRVDVEVFDPAGRPLPGALVYRVSKDDLSELWSRVRDESPTAYADADGRTFFSSGVPWCVGAARAPWLPTIGTPCPVGEKEPTRVVVRLTKGGTLVIKVSRGGRPVAGAPIRVEPDDVRDVTGPDGQARVSPLSPGPHKVTVLGLAPVSAELREVEVRDGEVTEVVFGGPFEASLEVHVSGTGTRVAVVVEGEVREPPESIPSGARVTTADERGVAIISGLKAGTFTVFGLSEAKKTPSGGTVVTLAPGQTAVVQVSATAK